MSLSARVAGVGNVAVQILLTAAALPALAVESDTQTDRAECRYAEMQPEDVNFDAPREQLRYQPDLIIPPDARIGEVHVHRQPIFDTRDPDQDNLLYRAINALNIQTWESTLQARLVFREGERYDRSRLDESERALREMDFLVGAWVRPFRVCGEQVDVAVVARDTWTFLPSVGFSRSGGETTTSFGLTDQNFLGSGKQVSVSRRSDADRTETSFAYHDPNVLGSRWVADLDYAERSDGRGRGFALERPFYREGARWSLGVETRRDRREDSLFFGGDRFSTFRRDLEEHGVHYGHSLGPTSRADRRLLLGYRYRRDRFSEVADEPPPEPFPQDRTLSYPWVGFEWQENTFHETINLTQMQRVEDIRDGIDFSTRLGYSAKGLGARNERIIMENRFSDGLIATDRQFADYRVTQQGHYRVGVDRVENLKVSLRGRYFHGGLERQTSWFTMLDVTAARNLTPDEQLLLGGDSGLRGYPRRYQTGDRRALFTLERRYFSNWHPLRLFRVGGVAFFDAGRTWFSDGRPNGPDEGILRDVGVGLRLASSRVEVTRMLHLDFAVPLDGDDDISRYQVLIRGRSEF